MAGEKFRYMSPEDLERCPGNVVVALVHEDVSFVKKLFDTVEPIRLYLIRQKFPRASEVERYHDCYYDQICEEILGADRERYEKLSSEEKNQYYGFEIITRDLRNPYEYTRAVSVLNDILYEEKCRCAKVYVSIMGSPVFAAAAATVVPMFDNAHLYTTFSLMGNTDEHLAANTYDGRLCGPVRSPSQVLALYFLPRGPIDIGLLKAFKLYCSISPEERTNANVIRTLMYNGCWELWKKDLDYVPSSGFGDLDLGRTSLQYENIDDIQEWLRAPRMNAGADEDEYRRLQKKEAVDLSRYYLEQWYALDWLENDSRGSRRVRSSQRIRSTGKYNIDMFCSNTVYPVGIDMICPSGAHMRYGDNDIRKTDGEE